MCYFSQQTKDAATIKRVFKAEIEAEERYKPDIFNGFTFPAMLAITNNQPDMMRWVNWGLIPHWSKDESIRKHTLNARMETIHQKPAFRSYLHQRCIVPVDGFFEWKWLDEKGKHKQRYLITTAQSELFAFAGLWSKWINTQTGEELQTYTIITQPANELMSEIHNTKKRMPLILLPDETNDWLNEKIPITPKEIELKATLQ
jgi:putative SOS response-associated peptidase YedK